MRHGRGGMSCAVLGRSCGGGGAGGLQYADRIYHCVGPFGGVSVFFIGPDGDTAVEPYRIDAKKVPMLKTGKQLAILNLPTSPKRGAEIVVGPPDAAIPMHPAPYKEMFIMLGGSTQVMTRTFKADMKPGSVLLFDDAGAKTGHAGHTGPCGYISLSIEP